MKHRFWLLLLLVTGCNTVATAAPEVDIADTGKIKLLNVGSFHFGATSDANTTEFDEHAADSQAAVRQLSVLLARFKPTIICLEFVPEQDAKINADYQAFLTNPTVLETRFGELSMVGFDVARLSGLHRVYGIDHHLGYNYSLGDFIEQSPELSNSVDRETYLQLTHDPFKNQPELKALHTRYTELSLLEKLQLINRPDMLDYSINTNADKLMYVALQDGFEGAEQAAQFYLRNMKIYTNLNRIPMTTDDRVLILMGAAHTAMLREFIKRSPKFELVDTQQYLSL